MYLIICSFIRYVVHAMIFENRVLYNDTILPCYNNDKN